MSAESFVTRLSRYGSFDELVIDRFDISLAMQSAYQFHPTLSLLSVLPFVSRPIPGDINKHTNADDIRAPKQQNRIFERRSLAKIKI